MDSSQRVGEGRRRLPNSPELREGVHPPAALLEPSPPPRGRLQVSEGTHSLSLVTMCR